ncbi:MAG: flagella basal body P-ring formation protein FlgA [Rickettsiales bacterium]|nr:flagella basal body P-ring formation protein FlgA [Rickettsiales bacterium]|tara:strand:+ start:472 stop:1446 length:975 start_codon:yes stop_codon:yes gene_type:complete
MKNRSIFALLGILGFAVVLLIGNSATNECLATSLKQQAIVKDDVVKLSDLFHDAGRHGERVVLQSPDPGRRMVLNAKWLYRTAKSFRLNWKPMSAMDHVVVERATHYISTEQIQETLAAGIRSELEKSDKFEIDLDNRLLQMHLPGEALPTVEIQTLRIERQNNRFSAILVGAGGRHRGTRITVTGKYYRIIDVPVLIRRMSSKEIIKPHDIRLVTRRADKVDMNGLRDVSELIGMSPLRTLSADRPVKRSEIRRPVLVGKGSIVTMVFRSERMMLTAQGKALQNGSKGDIIRILNTKTHKVIDGTVHDSGTVTVSPLGRLALR